MAQPNQDHIYRRNVTLTKWAGKAAFRKTTKGYVLEMSFEVPNVKFHVGKTIGLEVVVCDNDGSGRVNVMTWTGTKTDFWLVMDDYSKATLTQRAPHQIDGSAQP